MAIAIAFADKLKYVLSVKVDSLLLRLGLHSTVLVLLLSPQSNRPPDDLHHTGARIKFLKDVYEYKIDEHGSAGKAEKLSSKSVVKFYF